MNVHCLVSRTITLDEPTKKLNLAQPLAYTNAKAHAMQVVVMDEGEVPADLTGIGCTASFKRSDNTTVEPINGTISGNVAQVILPASCYVIPGRFTFTMDLSDGNGATRTVLWVDGMVEKNTSSEIVDPGTPVGNIEQAIGNANAAASAATTAATAANTAATNAANAAKYTAPTEASSTASKAYAVGDYFVYNGKLYITTSAIASGGTITPNTNCAEIPNGLSGEVGDLKSILTDVEGAVGYEHKINVVTANLINKNTAQDGYNLNATTGEPNAATGYSLTDFERCNPDSVYSVWWGSVALGSSQIATYDKDKNFIGFKNSTSGTNYKTTESNAYYIRVVYGTTAADTVMCVEGQAYPGDYSAYGNTVIETKQADVIVTKHVYVAPTGNDSTGDGSESNPYATIYHANETITDAGELKRYIIHVADGTYTDLQARYSGIAGSNYQGVICKDYVSYIGNVGNPAACILQWDGATGFTGAVTDADITYKGIFQILQSSDTKSYHVEIAGFTIDATNTRYCQHIEMSGYGYGADWYIHDCIFNWHGQPALNNPSYIPATIGTGCGLFEHGRFERCKIINDEGLTTAYGNHDNPDRYSGLSTVKAGSDIVFRDCVFNGGASGKTTIWCRSMYTNEGAETYDMIHVINCHGINELKYTTSGGADINWRAEVIASDITTNQFDTSGLRSMALAAHPEDEGDTR